MQTCKVQIMVAVETLTAHGLMVHQSCWPSVLRVVYIWGYIPTRSVQINNVISKDGNLSKK